MYVTYVTGVKGGLYYVRNGTLNDYALTFNLLLKPDVIDIYFSWNSSFDQPPVSDVTSSHAYTLQRKTYIQRTLKPTPPSVSSGSVNEGAFAETANMVHSVSG